VPIDLVEHVDPTRIGVDAAAQTILPGGEVPAYQARDVDEPLRAAVAAALDGTGRWLVVVTGRSKVGKSRALFEALRACAYGRVELVAPVDGDALRSLLTAGKQPRLRTGHAVLWLDDLEPFLNQGVTLQMLRAWRTFAKGGIVAGTYGGKGSDRVAPSSSQEVATLADTVLQEARQIPLETSSPSELARLPPGLPPRVVEDLERHGLAAFLVAAPKLERKLNTARHAPGQPESPQGLAVVSAAVDWARCGRTDGIARETLRELSLSYLPAGPLATAEAFDGALDWALLPVAGSIALLQGDGSNYRAYDYVVRFFSQRPGTSAPGDHAWGAALASAMDAQALAVATAAYRVGRFDDALTGFATASRSYAGEVASVAGYNHGVVLGELGRSEEELGVYDEVVARFADAPEPELREPAARALFNKAVTLGVLGRSEEELGVYDEVVARFADAAEPEVGDAVTRARDARAASQPQ
jgi:tetratricopeptide (TPR) repeat protein